MNENSYIGLEESRIVATDWSVLPRTYRLFTFTTLTFCLDSDSPMSGLHVLIFTLGMEQTSFPYPVGSILELVSAMGSAELQPKFWISGQLSSVADLMRRLSQIDSFLCRSLISFQALSEVSCSGPSKLINLLSYFHLSNRSLSPLNDGFLESL